MAELPQRAENFLLELRHEAHLAFPADRAERIVAETSAHLHAAVSDAALSGISPSHAAADAVSGFGDPRRLIQRLADATEPVLVRLARPMALAVALTLCTIYPLALLRVEFWPVSVPSAYPPIPAHFIGLALLAGLSFVARRTLLRSLLPLGLAGVMVALLFLGFDTAAPVQREYERFYRADSRVLLPLQIEEWRIRREILMAEQTLLERGIGIADGVGRVPPEIQTPDGIIYPSRNLVLYYNVNRATDYSTSALCKVEAKWLPSLFGDNRAGLRDYQREASVRSAETYRVTKDFKTAQEAWRKYGHDWIAGREIALRKVEREIEGLQQMAKSPPRFDRGVALQAANMAFPLLAAVLIVHLVAAEAGQYTRRSWNRWLWRLRMA